MAYTPPVYASEQGRPIQLYTTPLAATKFLKKPINVFGHWAICIDGYFYEVTKLPKKERLKKGPKHQMRFLPEQIWEVIKKEEERVVKLVEGLSGRTLRTYTQDYVQAVGESRQSGPVRALSSGLPSMHPHRSHAHEPNATQVWEKSFEKKYAVDATNCQVSTRIRVDLVGDEHTKAASPPFFDQWVKRAGVARDIMNFVAVGTMTTIAAVVTLSTSTVDYSGASAAAIGASANMALKSATALMATRVRQEQRIQKAQADLKESLFKM